MGQQRLRHFLPDAPQRIERHQRILQYEADLPAAHLLPLPIAECLQVTPAAVVAHQFDGVGLNLRPFTRQPDQRAGGDRFTGTGFAHQRQNFTWIDLKRQVAHRFHRPVRAGEGDV